MRLGSSTECNQNWRHEQLNNDDRAHLFISQKYKLKCADVASGSAHRKFNGATLV